MPSTAPAGIGQKLRSVRLERSLSIEETAWRTRIRPELLRAIEDDEYEAIGHEGFVRSHLSSYARFLGMNPSEVVGEFESHLEEPAPSAIVELEKRRRRAKKPPRPKWFVAALLSGALLAGAAAAGMLGGKAEHPIAPPLADRLAAPAISHTTSRSATRIVPVPRALAKVALRVEASAPTRVTIDVDGTQVFDGLLATGQARVFRALKSIELLAGNGGTVHLSLNGSTLADGQQGAVLRARFGPHGRL